MTLILSYDQTVESFEHVQMMIYPVLYSDVHDHLDVKIDSKEIETEQQSKSHSRQMRQENISILNSFQLNG